MELIKCACCNGSMSNRATACPMCGDQEETKASFHQNLAWFIVWGFSILALLTVLWASFLATGISAPQQCAVIASAIGCTVIPYCYARAVEKFERK